MSNSPAQTSVFSNGIYQFVKPDLDNKGHMDYIAMALKEQGVIVISGFFDKEFCDDKMERIVSSIEMLGSGVDRNDMETWIPENLPPQTRPGMYQGIIGNNPEIWEVRQNEDYQRLFKEMYLRLKPKTFKASDKLIASIDGVNIKPNKLGPYKKANSMDWAHMDQTKRGDTYACIQGQVVLSDSDACFRCSPRSHKVYEQILDVLNIPATDKGNWAKISGKGREAIEDECKTLVENAGGNWQVPVLASAGSVILWLSTCVHSAQLAEKARPNDISNFWNGWRGVFYICYRPENEFGKRDKTRYQKCIDENRVMNHWGTKLFEKNRTGRFMGDQMYHPAIGELIRNPEMWYDVVGKPTV